MTTQQLKELSGSTGPCISVTLPLHHEDQRQIRPLVKKAFDQIEQRLKQRNVGSASVSELMRPLRELSAEIQAEPEQKGVVILRSPDVFEHYFVPAAVEQSVVVSDRFNLLPLLPMLRESQPFYILALSQKHVRLLRCTNTSSEDVELPASLPRSLDDFLQLDRPDHVLDNASSNGPGMVMFGTTTEKERRDQHLLHFYKEIDRTVTEMLRNETAPLVIAGVEYELPLYRSVSHFPRLVDDGVHGSADGLKGGELHKRALEALMTHGNKDVEAALAMYEQFGGSNRTSVSLKDIVKGAFDGRVLHLFTCSGAHHMGNFDEMTHQVRMHKEEKPGDEDLINAAAVETLRHGGNVFVVPANKVPHGSQMAAVMRY